MEQDNYIHIYTTFLSDCYKSGGLSFEDVYGLLKEFEPVCGSVQSREDLANFLDTQTARFPVLAGLKAQLMDPAFVFPGAPAEGFINN